MHICAPARIKPDFLNRFTKNYMATTGFSGFVLTNKIKTGIFSLHNGRVLGGEPMAGRIHIVLCGKGAFYAQQWHFDAYHIPARAYGVGTMGRNAHAFVDFLKAAGQKYWQMLPLTPTGYGDSPYQSCSAYAGNPI